MLKFPAITECKNAGAAAANFDWEKRKIMNIFNGFGLGGANTAIEILLSEETKRKMVEFPKLRDGTAAVAQSCPLFFDGDSVAGKIQIRLTDGRKLDHSGIKVEFIGQIQLFYDRGNHYEFLSLAQELCPPGDVRTSTTYDFVFKNVEKQFESYHGTNAKLRYVLRVTIARRLANLVKEKELWVYSYKMPPEINEIIKMEVGIEDCLHIEFEYNKSKYHLRDVIVGKIDFLLVRIKIKNMELSIVKRESAGSGSNQFNESETITKFEIMDGSPVKGENFELTPTFRDINMKFSARYFLNLVLIDEENRRYFKQQEITIYRAENDAMDLQRIEGGHSIPGLASYSSANDRIEAI